MEHKSSILTLFRVSILVLVLGAILTPRAFAFDSEEFDFAEEVIEEVAEEVELIEEVAEEVELIEEDSAKAKRVKEPKEEKIKEPKEEKIKEEREPRVKAPKASRAEVFNIRTDIAAAAAYQYQTTGSGSEAVAPPATARAASRRAAKLDRVVLERPVLAIKSNMLFNMAGIPNLELELPIGYRLSISGEYQAMWWLRSNSFAMQAHTYGADIKWWPRYRIDGRRLTGWFIGGFIMAGFYDIQQSYNSGFQGEIASITGVSIGYVAPISRSFNLEFSAGAGYVITRYRWYDVTNDTYLGLVGSEYVHQSIIPAKVKISLSWLILRRVYK